MEFLAEQIRGVGYYPIVDDEMLGVSYCDECWGTSVPITADFEEVGVDSTYGHDSELDTPIHCDVCNALIKTRLSREGYYYVLDYVLDPECWSPTTATWAKAWSAEINERLIFGFGERR